MMIGTDTGFQWWILFFETCQTEDTREDSGALGSPQVAGANLGE